MASKTDWDDANAAVGHVLSQYQSRQSLSASCSCIREGRGGWLCIERLRRQDVMMRPGALRVGVVDVYASDDRGGRK